MKCLITDTASLLDATEYFGKMFEALQHLNATAHWNAVESLLFAMASIAPLCEKEQQVVPLVVRLETFHELIQLLFYVLNAMARTMGM